MSVASKALGDGPRPCVPEDQDVEYEANCDQEVVVETVVWQTCEIERTKNTVNPTEPKPYPMSSPRNSKSLWQQKRSSKPGPQPSETPSTPPLVASGSTRPTPSPKHTNREAN